MVLLCNHHGNSCQCWGSNNWGVRIGIGLGSCAVTMATAVIAGVRGDTGLGSCAASVITLVTVAAATFESLGIRIWSMTTNLLF